MRHWNYRVVRYADIDGKDFFSIDEVHYKDGAPRTHTAGGAPVGGNSLREIRAVMKRMDTALDKPILDAENWPQEWDRPRARAKKCK